MTPKVVVVQGNPKLAGVLVVHLYVKVGIDTRIERIERIERIRIVKFVLSFTFLRKAY